LYKIISTLNLVEQLQEKFPENNFIPVFWMATEDHDFQEINHIHLFGKEIDWDSLQSGAVGRMNLSAFESVLHELKSDLGESKNAEELLNLFENAYLKHKNLSQATRFLVNELFGKYGLVILDGDDEKLKEQFIPIIKKDVLQQGFVKTIKQCSEQLAKEYKTQAFVRDINFFTLTEGKRELIKGEITEKEIEELPEKFSPNVLLRPLYQETILPNIATIGGGAEVAYWMQLKTAFEQENIPFPILVLRNSVLLLSDKQNQKFIDLGFGIDDIFKQEHALQKKYVFSQTVTEISLKKQQEAMERVFAELLGKTTDIAMQTSIKAQLHKQLSALDKLEEKLIRNEKKKHETALQQISKIKNQLFPNNILQERYTNFIPFYLKHGDNFIEILKENLNPLNPNFVVLTL
jgi:bacillithiol biosynthesis cysteine-adding enzyme BshC